MGAIKINEFWIPENDIHLNDWKEGKPFTQNKCLLQFKEWCRTQHKSFETVIDVGAWAGCVGRMDVARQACEWCWRRRGLLPMGASEGAGDGGM